MSLPEISRRCRSCGAAVRSGARFCPQCGVPMADAAAAETDGGTPGTREVESPREPEPAREPETVRESVPVREPESPREVALTPLTGPPRGAVSSDEWTPPTKEYAAFAQAFGGADARPGAGETWAAGAESASAESAGAESPPVATTITPSQGTRVGEASRREDEPASTAGVESYDAAEEPGADGDAGDYAGVGADSAAGEARGRVARVRDGTRARVGRMREEAIVVLEETPDDSGMRFVAAAAALFVVFLVLLFLSTTILR